MNVKRSKLQRKYVNAMRGMADVPWPARRFKYPPTFACVPTGLRCEAPATVEFEKRRVLGSVRRPRAKEGPCGSAIVVVPRSASRRSRVTCLACERRAKTGRRWDKIGRYPDQPKLAARWHLYRITRQAKKRVKQHRKQAMQP